MVLSKNPNNLRSKSVFRFSHNCTPSFSARRISQLSYCVTQLLCTPFAPCNKLKVKLEHESLSHYPDFKQNIMKPKYFSVVFQDPSHITTLQHEATSSFYFSHFTGQYRSNTAGYVCYSPTWRSTEEKTVPEVSSMAQGCRPRAVLETLGTVFPYMDHPREFQAFRLLTCVVHNFYTSIISCM